jgi:UPF0755 protein
VLGDDSDSDERTAADRERAAARRAERRRGRDAPPPPETFAGAAQSPYDDEEPWDDEPGAAPSRTAVTDRRAAALAAVAARRRRLGAHHAPPPRSAGRTWGRRLLAVLAFAGIAAALYLINATFQPFRSDDEGRSGIAVSIPAGADAGEIGRILAARGIVDSGFFFQLNATATFRRGSLKPGDYQLPRGMSYSAAIDALEQGPKAKIVKTFNVTIPEGPSRREVAPVVKRAGVRGSYLRASGRPRVLARARRLGAPAGARTGEGFLFPSTYTLVAGAKAGALVDKQLDAFKANFRQVGMGYARRKNLTRYDVVIIASMIEREAQLARERPLVSAVIYNRLKQGIPLGIDATIRYATNNWVRPIRVSELQADGPYNTRLRQGLPPTPIGNPGLSSLKAAAHPAKASYLFYVRKPGNSGEHAFSSTNAQFERDVARYQASRGGP